MGKRNPGGRGGTNKQGNTLQSATRGFLKRERKEEERVKGGGGTGGDGRGRVKLQYMRLIY